MSVAQVAREVVNSHPGQAHRIGKPLASQAGANACHKRFLPVPAPPRHPHRTEFQCRSTTCAGWVQKHLQLPSGAESMASSTSSSVITRKMGRLSGVCRLWPHRWGRWAAFAARAPQSPPSIGLPSATENEPFDAVLGSHSISRCQARSLSNGPLRLQEASGTRAPLKSSLLQLREARLPVLSPRAGGCASLQLWGRAAVVCFRAGRGWRWTASVRSPTAVSAVLHIHNLQSHGDAV